MAVIDMNVEKLIVTDTQDKETREQLSGSVVCA